MKSIIYKYPLRPGMNEIVLPISNEICEFAQDPKNGILTVWSRHLVKDEMRKAFKFWIVATGEEFDSTGWSFYKTAVCQSGFVWHLLIEKASENKPYQQIEESFRAYQ